MDSVSPTAASASEPSRATKKASQTANTDSPAISSTMGTARRPTARFRLPSVKSCSEPESDSRTDAQSPRGGGEGSGTVASSSALMSEPPIERGRGKLRGRADIPPRSR